MLAIGFPEVCWGEEVPPKARQLADLAVQSLRSGLGPRGEGRALTRAAGWVEGEADGRVRGLGPSTPEG